MYQQNVSFFDELNIRSYKLAPIILYPRFSESEYKERILEMEALGITSIILDGKTILNSIYVAGKGCVGIVVKAKAGSKVYALKIRRTDADRKTMDNEAYLHKIANSIGVGPIIQGHTKNLIAMEFVEGRSIFEWVSSNPASSDVRTLTREMLEQCFRLDRAGLDHGELSRMTRHVIVSDSPRIIDFESASTTRRTSNVTAAAQSMFLYGILSNRVKNILGNTDGQKVVHALRTYKRSHTRANFDAVLESLLI